MEICDLAWALGEAISVALLLGGAALSLMASQESAGPHPDCNTPNARVAPFHHPGIGQPKSKRWLGACARLWLVAHRLRNTISHTRWPSLRPRVSNFVRGRGSGRSA